MDKFFQKLRPVIRWVERYPGLVVVVLAALAVLGGSYAIRLTIDSDISKLLPPDYQSVKALEKLRDTVGGESEASVVIESPSFEDNKRFAEALIPKVLALKGEGRDEPYFTHVDYRKDVSFLQQNALYFATAEELDSLENHLQSKIEEAKLEANPFFFDLEDEEEEVGPDSAEIALMIAYDRLIGQEYPISDDSTTMVLRFYPSGAQTDIGFIRSAYADLQKLVDEMQPDSYNAEMEITLAGRLLRQLIEVDAIMEDVAGSFGAGIAVVILVVVVYFAYKSYRARAGRRFSARILVHEVLRSPITAIVIALPLLASLSWTFGLVYVVYGSLNLMTSALALILFGMGIDYGIHFYGRYSEERGMGMSVAEAVEHTFVYTGQAIATTAFTTAAAFYVLMLADFRGFSEFGFISGTGILFALFAMTILMPAVLVLFERLGLLDFTAVHGTPSDAAQRNSEPKSFLRLSKGIIGVSVVFILVSVVSLPGVDFEYDFGKLDPAYEEYQVLQRKVRRVYNDSGRRNPAYIVVDDPAEVPAVEAAIRAKMAADTLSPTIATVESMQSRFPMTPEAQQAKLARIAEIRALLDDPLVQAAGDENLDRIRLAASTTEPITLDQVPEFLKAAFTSKDGQIGRLVIVYPSLGLSDGKNSMAFSEDVGKIETEEGTVYYAGSTSLVAADMLRLMQKEAPFMVGMTILLIIIFKFLTLRSLKWSLIALAPLLVGFVGMFGVMQIFGVKLNFYNLVVLPAVLGIGDDAGIHITHRYQEEGRGSILKVLRSTGEHITMSALTSMEGFGGLVLSFYPGMRSIGQLAVIGIGMTLLTALVFLPALLKVLEARQPATPAVVPPRAARPVQVDEMA